MDRSAILPPSLPTIDIVVLGVDSNKYAAAVEPSDDLISTPKVVFHPPQPKTVTFADAMFSGGSPVRPDEGQQP
jgi:hypothetical protein